MNPMHCDQQLLQMIVPLLVASQQQCRDVTSLSSEWKVRQQQQQLPGTVQQPGDDEDSVDLKWFHVIVPPTTTTTAPRVRRVTDAYHLNDCVSASGVDGKDTRSQSGVLMLKWQIVHTPVAYRSVV